MEGLGCKLRHVRKMINIVITLPHYFPEEANRITQMFESGLCRLHLRKPDCAIDDYRQLLDAIPSCYHDRIVIHEHFQLLKEYTLAGVHLNRRNPEKPSWWKGHVSRSCHTLDELRACKHQYDYVTLSPIFDSISKQGYTSAFTPDELLLAHEQGIIDHRVMALGGISHDNMDTALSYGFGGFMMLGEAWRDDPLPVVLTIAGSDSGGGAGIQQDSKVITAHSCYAATCITALTAQNTIGVQRVEPICAEMVRAQIQSVMSDLHVRAVKIGMIPNSAVALAIANALHTIRSQRPLPIIYDPVMVSTSGTPLMDADCVDTIIDHLLPLCTLLTPNIPEYELLRDKRVDFSHISHLKKGGHASADVMTDVLWNATECREYTYTVPKIQSSNLHGTGCTLSSSIAANMAQGHPLAIATEKAKRFITEAIKHSAHVRLGHGNGPLAVLF